MDVLELRGATLTPRAGSAPAPTAGKGGEGQERADWDSFVSQAEGATLFHLAGWKGVMERSFGLETAYFYAREGSDVCGVLPLLHVNSRLGGHYLTSLPGGLCARDPQAGTALLERAREVLRATGARYLVLRDGLQRWDLPDLVTDESHWTLRIELSAGKEEAWRRIKKRARQLTNQAQRAGVDVVDGTESFDQYYTAYSRSMRDKGTPTLGRRFFQQVVHEFPDLFRFLVVRLGDQVLGGGFVSPFRDTVYCTWGGMLRKFYDLRPNHALYWASINYGIGQNARWLDLGRSRLGSGTFVFKMNWGAEPRPLYQQYVLNGIRRPPSVGADREEDGRYRAFVSVWKRMPLWLAETAGPWLRRRMPFG